MSEGMLSGEGYCEVWGGSDGRGCYRQTSLLRSRDDDRGVAELKSFFGSSSWPSEEVQGQAARLSDMTVCVCFPLKLSVHGCSVLDHHIIIDPPFADPSLGPWILEILRIAKSQTRVGNLNDHRPI